MLVFGYSGQVATELRRRARSHGVSLVALDRNAADLSDPDACAQLVTQTDAQVVINAAAYTAVDQAEDEPDLARLINGDAPGAIARAAAKRSLPFLHISTDYVFDGSATHRWTTRDPTVPLGVYGCPKLDGETQVVGRGGWHAILRTSWVFSAHVRNFVKTILRLAQNRDHLKIVADQIGGPTPAAGIADTLLVIAKAGITKPGGRFHYSGTPDTSWAGLRPKLFNRLVWMFRFRISKPAIIRPRPLDP